MSSSRQKVRTKPSGSPPAVYPGKAQPFSGSIERGRSHDRPNSASKSSRSELVRTPEAAKNGRKNHTATTEDSGELSDLRRVLHVASEFQKIDLDAALSLYKTLMKRTKNEEHMELEEKYLESQNERMDQLASGAITREREDIQEQFNILLNEKERLKKENEKLESKCKASESLLEHVQRTEKENRNYKAELKSKDEALQQARKEKAAAMTEKDDALTRLSKELGAKLSDNNPSIADLSDPNRAMKLGEKYNELYDNEWTDAMEKLGDLEDDERKNVQKLLDILKKCHKVCVDISEKQMTSLQMTLVNPSDSARPKQAWTDAASLKTPKSIYKQLKDCRKEMSYYAVDNIYKEHASDKFWYEVKTIPSFVKRCIELCWLMCVQDPPVVVGGEATEGVTFDTNKYRPYTNSGTVVSYNVWPPLLLHENGPTIVKGVVQPRKVEKKKNTEHRAPDKVNPTTAAKPRTDYGLTHRVEPSVRLTGQSAYDPHEDAYGRYDTARRMQPQQNDTWRNHHTDVDYSKPTHKPAYTQEKVYDTDLYRSSLARHHVVTPKQDYQTTRPTTNYVQKRISPYTEKHLFQSGGITYIRVGDKCYNYELYKSVFGRDESYA